MTIPIQGQPVGSPDLAYERAFVHGAERLVFLEDYLEALYADAATLGINPDVLVGQWDLETDTGKSTYWLRDGNPAGLAAFDDGSNWGLSFTPALAARAHVTHMARYLGLDVPASWITTDARWQAVADAGYVGTVTTTDDLGNGKWATDPLYASKLRARYVAYWGEPEQKAPMANLRRFRATGLNRDLILPADVDVQNKIVNHSRVRSYSKFTSQTKTTIHDTGNDGTDAAGEYAWLAGGRTGGSLGGYNAITDASRIWFTVPHDEIVWHAGTPTGNQSWGVEWAYGKDKSAGTTRFNKSFEVNMRLHAAYCEAMGWNPVEDAVLHYFWYGKYCSRQILDRGWADEADAMMLEFIAEARAFRAGDVAIPPVVPTYKTPTRIVAIEEAMRLAATPDQPALTVAPRTVYDPQSKVTFIAVFDRVKAIAEVERDQYAYEGSPDVAPPIPAGKEFDVNWFWIDKDGVQWYLTPRYSRVRADKTVRVSDAGTGMEEV